MQKRLVIEGDRILDIPSFYAEINRVLMLDEDWQIGHSLDALNDLLYGGFGEIKQNESVQLVWQQMDTSKAFLGEAATKELCLAKLANPGVYNARLIGEKLAALEQGNGPTFFEIVINMIAEHPNIELIKS
ncbi:MAG: ribonuclease inhibitor [Sphingobacteriaceae bacterium]|nr:MAG: ribonuclease inhibitor [Sphingobacteriaceae bacterium]